MENLSVWEQSAVVIIAGLLIVFIGLILLIIVISIMGKIADSLRNRDSKPAAPAGPAPSAPSAPSAPQKSAPVKAETVQTGVPGEIIAVITAAIAAMTGSSNFTVKSVKRSADARPSGRSAWGNAGLLENTRPF